MPGFVDVSNMSALEVKRLGQADDCDDVDYQPRQRRAYAAPPACKYSVSDVWAAASAAQRVNGEYLKEGGNTYDDQGHVVSTRRRNRDIMLDFLNNPDRLLVEDVEQGEQARSFLQNDLTFRAVKGRLTEFDAAVIRVLAVSEHFDTAKHKYELAVVASLPASASRAQTQQTQTQRIKFSRGGYVGQVGDKVTAQVEVLSAVFSQNYGVFWIKGITDQDQPVFFSSKQAYDPGTWLTVRGTVKAHRDDVTQLTRVKVL